MALSKYFVNMYKSFCKTVMETMRIWLIIMFYEYGCMGPMWLFLLMYASRNTRRVDFRRLTGSQRTPQVWGVTKYIYFLGLPVGEIK